VDFRLKVPANLLLSGEYAITEEGGLGYSVALGVYATLRSQESSCWTLHGLWPGGSFTWIPGEEPPSEATFVARVWEHLVNHEFLSLECNLFKHLPPHSLYLDTTDFFDSQGRKRGFGSSAALTVALSAALQRVAQLELDPQWAVRAHRAAQGGKGSGYDVLTSFYGGWGRFEGGFEPSRSFLPIPTSNLPTHLGLRAGPLAVSTTSAIVLYSKWKLEQPQAYKTWWNETQKLHAIFPQSYPEFIQTLTKARFLAESTGDCIGVTARFTPQIQEEALFVKASGAGNETLTILPLVWPQVPNSPLLNCSVDSGGLVWN